MTQISDLRPNPKNPRAITDAKLEQLKKALTKFGDLGGFVYNQKTKRLVGGHQRAKVFDKADVVITKKFDKPTRTGTVEEGFIRFKGERFKYRAVAWDEITEKAANIAANKGAGEWDQEVLGEWMHDLAKSGFDLDLSMFDQEEREPFFSEPMVSTITSSTSSIEDDAAPELPKKAITQKGDIYLLGVHRLMCGDGTNQAQVAKFIGDTKIEMVFTDPPYGIKAVESGNFSDGKKFGSMKAKHNLYSPVEGDDTTDTAHAAIKLCRALKIPVQLFWGANFFSKACEEGKSWLVWNKETCAPSFSDCEIAYTNQKGKLHLFTHQWSGMIKDSERGEKRVHPTQKPVALASWCFDTYAPKAKNILDLFGGSGSTLIACEKSVRKCFMMEIDPLYCDVIIKRWEDYTGKKAKKLNGKNGSTA